MLKEEVGILNKGFKGGVIPDEIKALIYRLYDDYNWKERTEFIKETSEIIAKGEASRELTHYHYLARMLDYESKIKHGEKIKCGKYLAKQKREQSA